MNKLLIILLVTIITSCGQDNGLDLKDYVDHWEVSKTYKTFNNSSLEIDTTENEYEITNGYNQVLLVTIENKPVFKEGKELSDLYSTKTLLIELDSSDNIISANSPSKSKILRLLISFSPDYGINPLHPEENIVIKRKGNSIWQIVSNISDFVFTGEVDFSSKQILTEKHNHY